MSRHSVLMSGMAVVLIVSLASAQQRRGFGGRGFGGFGGFGGDRGSSTTLLGMREVQQEIGLRDGQKTRVDEVLGDLRDQTRSSFGNFRELSREERQERFAEARKKTEAATKEAEEQIAKILDREQAERLDQLRLQREGLAALSRPEISKRLGLNEDQLAKIKTIQEESRPQGRGGFGGQNPGGGDPGDFFARMQERREKMQADTLAVLAGQQKEKWAQMKGKEFEFPRPRGFGGFGGRGGGNAAERRRPPTKPRDQ